MNENYIRKHDPQLHSQIKNKFGDSYPFMESMWLFNHGMNTPPVCETCGGPVKFRNINLGYQRFCSIKCSNSNITKKELTKSTCRKRYGGNAPACSKEVSQRILKTTYENHGDDAFIRRTGPLSEDTKRRMRETTRKRYGVENVMMLDEFKDKCNSGKDYNKIGYKIQESLKIRRISKNKDIIDILEDNSIFRIRCPHPECNLCTEKWFDIPITRYHDRKYNHTELCTRILPIKPAGITNTYPEIFVKNILDEHSIEYETNNRTILSGKELDIYIPSRNLAIECNGVYWHSLKGPKYHYDKWRICKEQDIQLLTIWEDQIVNKPEIVKSIILSRLGIYKKRIGASKCKVIQVSSKDSTEFLNRNHIQGACKSSIRYGLVYKGNLVALMCFDDFNSRVGIGGKEHVWELVRFCSDMNTQVIHGAERLLLHFRKDYIGDIISFASHDISMGDLYEHLGFEKISEIPSSYWYIDMKTLKRYHRYSFTKSTLVKKGYDPSATEFEIMATLPYYRIYDSGQSKYILK